MEIEKIKAIIESVLFAAGRVVTCEELLLGLEIPKEDLENIIQKMQEEYKKEDRGIEIVKVDNGYQMGTKADLYEYIYPILDKRAKPKLSTAALETLAIIAYNPKITRPEIEAIRGVNADAVIYKLIEFDLITPAGKLDAPGRPTMYITTDNFLKMFGYSSLDDLPELPRYKVDENQQIIIDDIVEKKEKIEAPSPERASEELIENEVFDLKSDENENIN